MLRDRVIAAIKQTDMKKRRAAQEIGISPVTLSKFLHGHYEPSPLVERAIEYWLLKREAR